MLDGRRQREKASPLLVEYSLQTLGCRGQLRTQLRLGRSRRRERVRRCQRHRLRWIGICCDGGLTGMASHRVEQLDGRRRQGSRVRPAGGDRDQVSQLVVRLGGGLVDLQHRAVQRDAGKQSAAAAVGKDFRSQLSVGGCRSLSAHRTCGCRRVGADGELAVQQALDAFLRPEDQDYVRRLQTDLPADTAARHGNKNRRPPGSLLIAHQRHASPVTHSDDKTAFEHPRYDRQALGVRQQILWDAGDRRRHDLVQDVGRRLNGLVRGRLGPSRRADPDHNDKR